ncbi:MAG TPA: MFS transporter [Kofleriaceae bacterium]|nr:MFS transporter [Kofleriaceae bacterium]
MTPSPPHSSPPGARSLWRHADFLRLWSAQAISAFGSRITRTALPIIAVVTLGQSEAMIGVLAAMQLVPGMILAIAAGGLVDRGHKRRILITADLIRGALVASLTLAWALDALSMVQVIAVGALVGAASALFQITDVAYLPQLIGRRQLAEGNAKLETTEAVAEITGPASAGVLIAALGAPLAVAIDAASFVWSAFMLDRIRGDDRGRSTGEPAPAPPPPSSIAAVTAPSPSSSLSLAAADDLGPEAPAVRTGRDFWIGARAVFGHPQVRPVILTVMMWSVTGGFFIALYTPFCLRALALPESVFGVIIAMGGVGSLAGAMLSRGLARALGVGRTLIVTSAVSIVFTLCIPIAASVGSRTLTIGFLAAHQLIGDGMSVAFVILAVTLRQTALPRDVLGRANAAIHVSTTGMLVVSAVLAGGLASLVGIHAAMWAGTLAGLIAPALLWPLRRLRDMPSADLVS